MRNLVIVDVVHHDQAQISADPSNLAIDSDNASAYYIVNNSVVVVDIQTGHVSAAQ